MQLKAAEICVKQLCCKHYVEISKTQHTCSHYIILIYIPLIEKNIFYNIINLPGINVSVSVGRYVGFV